MSNKVGDRYSCSDPDCGCVIEIERPCNMIAMSLESEATFDNPRSSAGRTSIDIDDAQIAAEAGAEEPAESRSSSTETVSPALICFCGNEMREATPRSTRARAARPS